MRLDWQFGICKVAFNLLVRSRRFSMDKCGLRLFIINLHWCGHGFQMQPHVPQVVERLEVIHVLGPGAFASSDIQIGGNGRTSGGQGCVILMQN